MDCFIALAEAISNTDQSLRNHFLEDVDSTVNFSLGLVNVDRRWQEALTNDRNEAVDEASSMAPGSGALAAAWDMQYQTDSRAKDSQTEQWQALVESNQAQIDATSDYRKANFSLANGAADVLSTENNLLVSFR